jgi:hypothetical protein
VELLGATDSSLCLCLSTLKLTLSSPLAFLLSCRKASIEKCQKFTQQISDWHALDYYPEMPFMPMHSKLKGLLEAVYGDTERCRYRATAATSQVAEPEDKEKIKQEPNSAIDSRCKVYVISLL